MTELKLADNQGCFGCGQQNRIGLKLGLQRQTADGVFSAIKFDASFGEYQDLRLTAEANTDGYLYVVEAGDGSWRWLFPPPGDSGARPAQASIRAGQQVKIPLLDNARSSRDPGKNKLFIILSRNEIQELAASSTKTPRHAALGQAIQGLLNTWSSTTEDKPVIVEERTDQTIYFVPNAPMQTAPLVIEFDVARR